MAPTTSTCNSTVQFLKFRYRLAVKTTQWGKNYLSTNKAGKIGYPGTKEVESLLHTIDKKLTRMHQQPKYKG